MAAPAFGSVGTGITGTSTAANIGVPAGVAAGDIIVVVLYNDGTATVSSMPSGFAHATESPQVATSQASKLNVMWKRATGSDAGTYDFTLSASVFREGFAARFMGAAASGDPWEPTPDGAVVNNPNPSGTSPAVSVTTGGPDRLLVWAAMFWNGGGWTPPAGFTERYDTLGERIPTLADKVQASAGSSGSVSTTVNSTVHASAAWLGALLPAANGTVHNATASGTATSGGTAAARMLLVGSASGSATSAGTAAATMVLICAASGSATSTGSAAATIVPAGPVTHQATATGTATSAGSAAVTLRLAGSASGLSLSTGGAALALLLAAAAQGLTASSGSAAATIPGSVIERPNTGTISRPDTGIVTRPDTGVVGRP